MSDYIPYSEQLKRQEWKDKKDHLIAIRGSICEDCGRRRKVEPHHKYYESKRMAWDYPDDCFKLLCRECHQHTTLALTSLLYTVGSFTGDQLVTLTESLQVAVIESSPDIVHNWLLYCLSDLSKVQVSRAEVGL